MELVPGVTVACVTQQPDPIRRRLEALAKQVQRDLADVAEVRWEDPHWITLIPRNERALAVTWFDTGDELQVETLGGEGGRWELPRDDASAEFLEGVVRAVVAGRVTEVFGEKRSAVTVRFADGTTDTATVYGVGSGCLPMFGWKRRGPVVRYEPYDGRCRYPRSSCSRR